MKATAYIDRYLGAAYSILRRAFCLPILLFLTDADGGGGQTVKEIKDKVKQGKYRLYCLLIYSDLDHPFISFMEETHDAIALMSGPKTFVFWFEHFRKDIALLIPSIKNVDDSLGRNQALKIARLLGIPNSKLPCFVFFTRLRSEEAVLYSFDNNWGFDRMAEHTKAIFDVTASALTKSQDGNEKRLLKSIHTGFKNIRFRKWVKRITTRESFETLLKTIATGASVV